MKYKLNLGVVTQRMRNKITIFTGESSKLYTLNETAGDILQGIKLEWSREKILEEIIYKYDVTKEIIEKDFDKMIKYLVEEKIISKK